TRPNRNPSAAAASDIPLRPDAANPMPAPAIVAVTAFGMRRVRISTTIATSTPTARAMKDQLEIVGNGLPEERVHSVPHAGHGTNREQRNQRHQQAVLQQVLPFFLGSEPRVRDSPQRNNGNGRLHGSLSNCVETSLDRAHDRRQTMGPAPGAGPE